MADYLASLGNALVDRSPDELIGAVLIAVTLALALAGLFWIGRRKFSDVLMPVTVLMIVGNVVAMTITAGYLLRLKKPAQRPSYRTASGDFPPGHPPLWPDPVWVETLFRVADKNQDGLVSADEASVAAADFVRKADLRGRGAVDGVSLGILMHAVLSEGRDTFHYRSRPPFGPPPPPPYGPTDPRPPTHALRPSIGPPPAHKTHETANPTDARGTSGDSLPEEPPTLE